MTLWIKLPNNKSVRGIHRKLSVVDFFYKETQIF